MYAVNKGHATGVDSYRSNSSTTLRKETEARYNVLDAIDTIRDLLDISTEFLTERERSSILREFSA